jgi:shikimate kinase
VKTSIALIGFMGTGKTVVGKLLAEKLNKRFLELDAYIEKKAGKSINEIFKQGEIAFRELEIDAVKDIFVRENQVVACGGGVVLNRINIDRLKQNALICYLTATPLVIMKRTMEDSKRPLLEVPNRIQRINDLLKFRRPFYERAADFPVNTSRSNVQSVVSLIIEKLRMYES